MVIEHVLNVFVVEDSKLIVDRIKDLLSEVSGTTLLGNVQSVQEALDFIRENPPDVVILDIHLGNPNGPNGIDLLFAIRQIFPSLIIIMLTNHTHERYRALCREGGADYFLDKSHDFEKIGVILEYVRDTLK